MKIVVWNLKGGQGKTVLSLSIALLRGSYVVTNDTYSPIEKVLPEGHALQMDPDDDLPQVPDDIELIYDFGGYPDARVIEAVKQADAVLIPIIYESPLEMQVTINALEEVERYTDKIVVIANKCQGDDVEKVREVLGQFYDYPVLEIKKSTAFSKAIEQKKSMRELMESSKLLEFHYKKPLAQLEELLSFITE
ncbi:MAG: hypothetical protein HWE20_03935 [Gammaproteobacteria bacterium]|nr:hypothetical protein [Gammaproteobacteria bacterium]